MSAGNRSDDEDTREHPVPPRFPDAAPPAGETEPRPAHEPGLPSGTGAAGEEQQPRSAPPAGASAAPAGAQPAGPEGGQQWQAPQGQQWQPQPGWIPPGQQPQAQPGQQWQAQPGWGPPPGYLQPEYGTSAPVVGAGILLLVFGLLLTLIGVVGVALGRLVEQMFAELGPLDTPDFDPAAIRDVIVIVFAVVLVLGLLHLISAVGVFLHKQWARIVGIILAALGTLVSVLSVVGQLAARGRGDGSDAIVPVAIALGYGFSLFALIAGSNHFRRRYQR